jgi:glycosyltransferase involved in cell wall biosynthesis
MLAYTYYESDTRVIREAEAAVEGGFEVDFLALRKPGSARTETVRGVRVIRLNQAKYRGRGYAAYVIGYLMFFLRCLVASATLYPKRRYRVIHVSNMPDLLVFSTIVPKFFGAKVILDIHDPMPDTFASKFKGPKAGFFYQLLLWQERLSAAYSDRTITVHEPVREGILLKHGFKRESVGVIANFADEKLFPLRKSFSSNGKVRLVFHGTILERSGLGSLVTAMAKVRHKECISLKIIGEGDFSPTLTTMIESLGLGDIVEFDNHTYPAHLIGERLADCNLGVVPLEVGPVTNYALPLKLLEYISMGLPVASVRNYAISYYLGDDDCLFFEWNDPKSLSALLDRIAECPEILMQYRQRSIALRRRFSWSVEKKKYVILLRELVGAVRKLHPDVCDTRNKSGGGLRVGRES